MTATLPTIDAPAIPARFTLKPETDSTVQAAAKVWLAAKCVEDAAKGANADRKQAETVLASSLKHGETVTLNGNATYAFSASERARANDSAILKAIAVLHPDVAATIANLREDARYRTPFTVYGLKPTGR